MSVKRSECQRRWRCSRLGSLKYRLTHRLYNTRDVEEGLYQVAYRNGWDADAEAEFSPSLPLFKSTVLPLLDYCSCVWDPYQTTYINMIEGVQKFAARLATKQWNTSYNDLLAQLGWPLLSTRRKQQKLFLCHRILSGYSIIPPSSFTPHPSPTLRHSHHLPLYRPITRSTAYSASFFPSVIPLWNNLPRDTVLATSHSAFKSKIKLNSNFLL